MIIVAGVCWWFPPFHVISLEQARQAEAEAAFDPIEFAEVFWTNKLLMSLDQAVPLEILIPAIQKDPAAARTNHGRTVGISESYTYFVSGAGRVIELNEDEIRLATSADTSEAGVALQVGLLFNTAVRDGTGLLDVNDYPNSQDFNAIAEALNRIVEESVQPPLRQQAQIGRVIQFIGCAEVNDEATDLKPLKVVPIKADAQ